MFLTKDQKYLLSILRETGDMRLDQVLPLMRLYDPQKQASHCEAILRHLRYCGELMPRGNNLICLPELREEMPDSEMLDALDILLALATGPPLQISRRRAPYKLCFLLEREDGRLDSFAVLPVEPGREQMVSILMAQQSKGFTVPLLLSALEQSRLLQIHQKHYFVIRPAGCDSFKEVMPANERPEQSRGHKFTTKGATDNELHGPRGIQEYRRFGWRSGMGGSRGR